MNKILLPYQQRFVEDSSALKIWLASRQAGKSFAIAMEAVKESLRQKCDNLILSASERQSKEVMRKVYSHLRYLKMKSRRIIKAARETKEEVTLPNGSRIISLPANPDTVRGFSGNVFLDEFAFHKDSREIWRAMYPAVTRGYKIRVTSTPNGKSNMFYELYARGENFSKHKTDIYDAAGEGLDIDIEELRNGAGEPDSWAQEFECRFVDEAAAFITYEMIAACEHEGAGKDYRHGDTETRRGEFFLGVDIGRKRDLTVFWLWEKVGDVLWTRMVHEMRSTAFREQGEFLFGLLEGNYFLSCSGLTGASSLDSPIKSGNDIRRACIDSTGIGAQLAEEAKEKFGSRVEAVPFTGKVKEDLAVTFKRKFEDRLARIPIDKDIREDIHSVRKFTTSSGNIRFDAERTEAGHADRFWAGALGVHASESRVMSIAYETVEQRRLAGGARSKRPELFRHDSRRR